MRKIIIAIILILSATAGFRLRQILNAPQAVNLSVSSKVHLTAIKDKMFYTGLLQPGPVLEVQEKVYGAIVSHHFLAEREIADLFLRLKLQKPSTVVLVGPNHFNAGRAPILVSKQDYLTPWGRLKNDSEMVEKIVGSGMANIQEQPFETEHSISNLTGFIKYVFPEVKIMPVIIKRGSSLKESENLGKWLANNLPANSLIIVSADFSHHFDLKTTLMNDAKSLEVLKTLEIARLSEAEVDSPQALALLFAYLQEKKAQKMYYSNTNSAFLLNNLESKDITSYFFTYFILGGKSTEQFKKQ